MHLGLRSIYLSFSLNCKGFVAFPFFVSHKDLRVLTKNTPPDQTLPFQFKHTDALGALRLYSLLFRLEPQKDFYSTNPVHTPSIGNFFFDQSQTFSFYMRNIANACIQKTRALASFIEMYANFDKTLFHFEYFDQAPTLK